MTLNADADTDLSNFERSLVSELNELMKEDAKLYVEVQRHLSDLGNINSDLKRLDERLEQWPKVAEKASELSQSLSDAAQLAEKVSYKIRTLDLAKGHVAAAMQRVEDIIDLKFCTDGVQTALNNEEYETAAAHIHRFLALDEFTLKQSAAASEGTTLESSFSLLHEAETKLKSLVHNKFDAAVRCQDVASVERFFKLFPLLNLQDDGLFKYSRYLCSGINDKFSQQLDEIMSSTSQPTLYSDLISALLELVAQTIEIHQPLVETYYGPGRMLTFLKSIQFECDRQVRRVMELLYAGRDIDKIINRIQTQHHSSKERDRDVNKFDARELDSLLTEITMINTRTELYLRFVRRRVVSDIEIANPAEKQQLQCLDELRDFLNDCDLSHSMQDILGKYILLEEYFMREMVQKAVSMDTIETDNLTSSMIDEVFYIIQKSLKRTLGSSSIDGMCAMINNVTTVIQGEFHDVLFTRLKNSLPTYDITHQAYTFMQSSLGTSTVMPSRGAVTSDVMSQKSGNIFRVSLNNVEACSSYIQKLKLNIESEIVKLFSHLSDKNRAKLDSCLADLGATSRKFSDTQEFGFGQLTSAVIKPKLRIVIDKFVGVNFAPSDEEFAEYELSDPWVQSSIVEINAMLDSFRAVFTEANFEVLVVHVGGELVRQLEKAVSKKSFNRLGGLQFDRDVRNLLKFMTHTTSWSIREKFARLTQIATVLNMETAAEIKELLSPEESILRLTQKELRQVMSLRVDFKRDDIKRHLCL